MNENQFDKTERREVREDDFDAALKAVFLAPKGKVKSENRRPRNAELEERWRLDRKPR